MRKKYQRAIKMAGKGRNDEYYPKNGGIADTDGCVANTDGCYSSKNAVPPARILSSTCYQHI